MRKNKCNILLILDYARQKEYSMSNMHIAILLPGCTEVLQTLDTSIIQSFKAHYQKNQVYHKKISKDNFSPSADSRKKGLQGGAIMRA